jgi:hypothetical protein
MIIEAILAAWAAGITVELYLQRKKNKTVLSEIETLKTGHRDLLAVSAQVLEKKVAISQGTAICSKCKLHVARFRVNADGSATCKNCDGK